LRLVLEMSRWIEETVGLSVRRAVCVERSKVRIEAECLMVKLEATTKGVDLRVSRERIAPAARVPLPAHARLVQPVADWRSVGRIRVAVREERMVVVDRQQSLIGGCPRAEG